MIRENLIHTKLSDNAETMKSDVFSALKTLGSKGRRFDIIFMDPPYAAGLYEKTLETIVRVQYSCR